MPVRVWMLMIQLETTMTMDERVRHKSAANLFCFANGRARCAREALTLIFAYKFTVNFDVLF